MENAAASTHPQEIDPTRLAHAIAQGETEAETQLFTQYRPLILRLLVNRTHDAALAEDLTHETMIAVLQKLRKDGLRDAAKLKSYAFQTAKYQLMCWARRSANRVELEGSLDHIESGDSMPEKEYISEVERECLHESIQDLKVERDREILMRHYVHEQSKPEICEALLLSSQHFDRVISRARLRLRQGLEQHSAFAAF